MNRKEIAEIKKRMNADNSAIGRIRGCYVNNKKEVVSAFERSLISLPQEEAEKYMGLFKKVLSGAPGKNLLDISISNGQVLGSEEHRMLTALYETELKDDESVQALCMRIMDHISLPDNYLILLMQDAYDVPYRTKDDMALEDASGEVYSYVVCAVCPVKPSKPALQYVARDNEFHTTDVEYLVAAPEVGFLFPAFDDRATNIYDALYYTKDTEIGHPEFVRAVFNTEPPVPADVQKETFQSVLADSLEEECSLDVVQAVQESVRSRVEEQKADKEAEPVTLSKREVRSILEDCQVSEGKIAAFEERYDQEFGEVADLSAENVVETARFEVKMPDVIIRVAPEKSNLVQTRVIDGVRYILVRADEGVEVNGVTIH